jgi:nicotinate-nucleotide pyrophosphorylase
MVVLQRLMKARKLIPGCGLPYRKACSIGGAAHHDLRVMKRILLLRKVWQQPKRSKECHVN